MIVTPPPYLVFNPLEKQLYKSNAQHGIEIEK